MHRLFLLTGLLSFSALACPDLAGHYKTCGSSSGNGSSVYEVIVSQKVVKKIHHFTITSIEEDKDRRVENYKADGKMKTVKDVDPDTGIEFKTITQAACSGNVLNLKMNATVDDEVFADISIKVSKSNNQLIQVYSGVSMGDQINETIVCE